MFRGPTLTLTHLYLLSLYIPFSCFSFSSFLTYARWNPTSIQLPSCSSPAPRQLTVAGGNVHNHTDESHIQLTTPSLSGPFKLLNVVLLLDMVLHYKDLPVLCLLTWPFHTFSPLSESPVPPPSLHLPFLLAHWRENQKLSEEILPILPTFTPHQLTVSALKHPAFLHVALDEPAGLPSNPDPSTMHLTPSLLIWL